MPSLMTVTMGVGGWTVWFDIQGLPPETMTYVRFVAEGDRLRIGEVYVDARGRSLGAEAIRSLPLASFEAVANEPDSAEWIRERLTMAGPDLSTLASYFDTPVFNKKLIGIDWVAMACLAQIPGSGVKRPARRTPAPAQTAEVPQLRPPTNGLTDDFFRQVAAAYERVVQQGLPPAPTLAEEAGPGVSTRTVHRWFYLARKAGIMQPGRRGVAGTSAGEDE